MPATEPAEDPRAGSAAAEAISAELERVVRRWQQLPLDRALIAAPTVVAMAQQIADDVADHQGMPHHLLPDLGPAVLMDQLRVMVFDHRAQCLDGVDLAHRLADLRRSLP